MSGRLLILRPQPGADSTAAKARAMGLSAHVHPLFELASIDWDVPDPAAFDAILFTSANTLRLAGEQLAVFTHLPAYAVGGATAEAARAAGFSIVHAGEFDVAALVPVIASAGHLRLFHPGGVDRKPFDPGPIQVQPVPVYASRPIGEAPAVQPGDIALLHSPRAGARLASLLPPEAKAELRLAAISDVAAERAGEGWRSVHIAAAPSDQALLALCVSLCQ